MSRPAIKWLAAAVTMFAAAFAAVEPEASAWQGPARPAPLVGLSAPSRIAAVGAEQSGTIVSMPVAEGSRVAANDLLFQLSSRLQELEVARLEALAQSDLDRERAKASNKRVTDKLGRLRELSDQQMTSRSALDDVELESQLAHLSVGMAELERAQLENQLQQARVRLQQRTLKSPFDGVVTHRFKQAGETVEQLLPVIEVMSLDPLWIEFECPVADEQSFRLGGQVRVRPAIGEHAARTAEIVYLAWKATASSHTFLVRASLPNPDYSWRAGLKMVVEPPAGGTSPAVQQPAQPAGK